MYNEAGDRVVCVPAVLTSVQCQSVRETFEPILQICYAMYLGGLSARKILGFV